MVAVNLGNATPAQFYVSITFLLIAMLVAGAAVIGVAGTFLAGVADVARTEVASDEQRRAALLALPRAQAAPGQAEGEQERDPDRGAAGGDDGEASPLDAAGGRDEGPGRPPAG